MYELIGQIVVSGVLGLLARWGLLILFQFIFSTFDVIKQLFKPI